MALAQAVATATRPSQVITWTRADGIAEDLTGATLTGTIRNAVGTVRAITGTLTATTPSSGIFTWGYSAADVATTGKYTVQFTATFATPPTVAKTVADEWVVLEALVVTA